ncbi:hypothetical protein [Marinobacterium litorale]|uniref:hypothetical protein n=1 Tax=Marinobacterium litorale TaxID=404770 RepID=UPI0004261FED|nr:hypothetical protein [Marinobacterium litorale]
MQLTRCPICHSRIHLDALVQDDAGRELLALLSNLDRAAGRSLVSYMTLFRSKSRDLASDRALRIAKETLDLAPIDRLVPALITVVEQMQVKQDVGGFKPLSNHNYLRKVVESSGPANQVEGDIDNLPADLRGAESKNEKRARVTAATMDIKNIDW